MTAMQARSDSQRKAERNRFRQEFSTYLTPEML